MLRSQPDMPERCVCTLSTRAATLWQHVLPAGRLMYKRSMLRKPVSAWVKCMRSYVLRSGTNVYQWRMQHAERVHAHFLRPGTDMLHNLFRSTVLPAGRFHLLPDNRRRMCSRIHLL